MTLTNLLGNKTHALVLGAALTACGDTINNTYVLGGNDEQASEANCETAVENTWNCGLYESDGDYGDPDFY